MIAGSDVARTSVAAALAIATFLAPASHAQQATTDARPSFSEFLAGVRTEALARGIPADLVDQALFQQTRQAFMAAGADAATATSRAYAAIFGLVQRQAAMVAFVGIFQLMAILFLALIPLVLLMKRPRRAEAPAGAH